MKVPTPRTDAFLNMLMADSEDPAWETHPNEGHVASLTRLCRDMEREIIELKFRVEVLSFRLQDRLRQLLHK